MSVFASPVNEIVFSFRTVSGAVVVILAVEIMSKVCSVAVKLMVSLLAKAEEMVIGFVVFVFAISK